MQIKTKAIVYLALVGTLVALLYSPVRNRMDADAAFKDANLAVRSLVETAENAPRVLAEKGAWPDMELDGVKASIQVRPMERKDLVRYDIVARVDGADACKGALDAGGRGANMVHVNGTVLVPQSLLPYTSGKHTVEPSWRICKEASFPATLRFERIAGIVSAQAGAKP